MSRDSAGKPIRNEQGLAVLVADERDSQYLEQLELYHQRVAVLVVAEALKADPHVAFETPSPKPTADAPLSEAAAKHADDWGRYADDLYRELEQAGFSAGDLVWLCDEIGRMSNLLTEHVREAGRNFSSAGRGPS